MKTWQIILGATAASLLAAVAIVRGPQWSGTAAGEPQGTGQGAASRVAGVPLPWQVTVHPDGSSEALGLRLGSSTLGDARQRFGPDTQIAIIAAPGEDGTLEAFVDPAQAGFIVGKLVITAELSPSVLRNLRDRALKSEFMESTTRKYTLRAEDEAQALQARIVALSFIPQAKLDAEAVLARFGPAAARVRSNGQQEHFLYPEKGLDVIVDSDGKELLQYVAPRDFDRLRAPLLAASAASAAR